MIYIKLLKQNKLFMEFKFNKKEYRKLSNVQTQIAIKFIKDKFQGYLSKNLNLLRVSAPIFLEQSTGLNDDLNGVERKVSFTPLFDNNKTLEVIQSLAKWKRYALKKYNIKAGDGIYTDMNAIRRDEVLDQIHSLYVDQWDWEKIIKASDRNVTYLKNVVLLICDALDKTIKDVKKTFKNIDVKFNKNPFFITSEKLLQMYPKLSPSQRENEICKKHNTVFVIGVGDKLSNGFPHDSRAPDYDDWKLNGDLLVYDKVLKHCIELSSMGIRVDDKSMKYQLKIANKTNRLKFDYHKLIINKKLPLTIGGGIGQSRLCLYILQKGHIGEVQASVWDKKNKDFCSKNNLKLL